MRRRRKVTEEDDASAVLYYSDQVRRERWRREMEYSGRNVRQGGAGRGNKKRSGRGCDAMLADSEDARMIDGGVSE